MLDWLVCPVCGERGTIIPGRYQSLLTGEFREKDDPELIGQLGKPGPWWGFTIESDYLKWETCPGYLVSINEPVRHLTEEEQRDYDAGS